MRSCCTIYVDVGYLLAAAATRVTGSSLRRGVQTDYAALIRALEAQAEADSGLPLLRVIWYDAGGRPGGMPDLSQDEIGLLPRVKLRLGRLSYTGEQKGVDVRIGLDLAIQARQRVADVVYLVSGDDDLTEAVEEAQAHGVQVILLAVPRHDGKPLAVSKHLLREVDRTLIIDPAAIDAAVRPTAIPEALIPAADGEPEDGQPEPAAGPGQQAEETSGPADGGQSQGGPAASAPRVRRRVTRVAGVAVPGPPRPRPGPPGSPTPGPSLPDSATPTPGPTPVKAVPAAAGPAERAVASEQASPAGEKTKATREAAEPKTPGVPSPALFASRRAVGVALPGAALPPAQPEPGDGLTPSVIDSVARQVVVSWCTSATPDSLSELRRSAPIIPSDLDRALLLDLSSHEGGDDLDDEARHKVRERFWHHIGRVRPI
ncbi:NYN domain-containing protein [Gephyromycinifex aptenodytis]|uniref:NYN domain-containing protein n=1 Tax=Gephyromycinifex aptenodytis TaxID=2716227 RepID=UPI0014486168|nr:NYN domain-containing protein [Gephyromycinifex aptenodytis]